MPGPKKFYEKKEPTEYTEYTEKRYKDKVEFTALKEKLEKLNAVILGVSPDSAKSHGKS